MGAKAVASAAGTAALVYLVLSGRLSSSSGKGAASTHDAEPVTRWRRREEDEDEVAAKKREERWPERAPSSWREAVAVAARTAGFAYGETLGKWPLGDIAFGINHYMRIQGNLQHEFTGNNCAPLEGPGVRQELIGLLRYLRLCMFFSKKPYEVFLQFGGYGESDILIRKSKARLMKPAFTVVRDESTRCFLLFIRGAISAKERLTAATAAEVPFHHSVLQEGRRSNAVAGHAHCGMVAAARWIADQAIPCLTKAVEHFPDYRVKIIGHSMGASIAAILTYMLRENKKLSSSSGVAFGPAACMTWDLAESGKDFVTTIINKNDLVPSFGKASAANLRTEVMASSWAPDLREQIQRTRILGFVNRSVSFMRSHTPFVSNPGSKVVDIINMQLSHTPMVPQTLEPLVNPTQDIAALMPPYVGNDRNTGKPTAGESASCSPDEPNHHRSDAEETDKEEKAAGQEHMDQLLEALRSSSSTVSQETHQLYPPGRIMHMVVLPAPEEPSTSEQRHQDEVVAIYKTPRGMYRKIRLAKSMIRDHYMPRYIETMEMMINKLAESDGNSTSDRLRELKVGKLED